MELQDHDRRTIVARSRRDRGPIVANIGGFLTAKSGQNQRGIEALSSPSATAPTTPSNDAHDRFNWPRSSDQFPSLKACIPLFCSSTFDRLVKKLSEFRGISLVHHVPPAFILDSKGIGPGLIANSSLISSNFPLEFRKSVRKDPSIFTPIRTNWSLILVAIGLVVRFDRLSRGNLSFY